MIFTVTLNPCLDRHLVVDQLRPDDANRIAAETRYAAGKGVDISRVIAELDGHSIALGFLGGFEGMELEGRLINGGVQCHFTGISGETRTNLHIFDRSTRSLTSLNAPGPEITPIELGRFCRHFRRLSPAPTFVALSGSVPRGVTKSIYNQLGLWSKSQGARVILDADGEAFAEGVRAAPFAVKPNRHELGRFVGRDLERAGIPELLTAARPLLTEYGIQVVMVSLGGEGLLLTTRESAWHLVPPPVNVLSTIGAGDSLLGGFMVGLERDLSILDAAVQGVLCGAATAMTPGTALCKKENVAELQGRVEVHVLPTAG